MSPLEDASDNDVENLVEGESLMVRRALNMQVKENDWRSEKRTSYIQDVMLRISYAA
jgi:hypothetical protein